MKSRERSTVQLEQNNELTLPENVHQGEIVARGISIEENEDLQEVRTKNEEQELK